MKRSHVVEIVALRAAVAAVGKTKESADEPHRTFMTHISAIYRKIKGLRDQEVI